MKLISFDIGIKNLAYCIFSIESTSISIIDWNVLNLMDQEQPIIKCNCLMEKKRIKKSSEKKSSEKKSSEKKSSEKKSSEKKSSEKKSSEDNFLVCSRNSEWKKGDNYYCKIHTKHAPYIIPKRDISPSGLKKKKMEDLQEISKKYEIDILGLSKKKDILAKMDVFFIEKCFEPLVKLQEKTAGETDLITIGRNMKDLLNAIPNINDITHVIMENQISTLATRMKTVQGMLAQYFIMISGDTRHIEFVSSLNKLKLLPKLNHSKSSDSIQENPSDSPSVKTTYKQHKSDGVHYTRLFIENNDFLTEWKTVMDTKKKDDLADSFLQGIWWLKHNNIIIYAENLKINNI
jgi:hypothetical protein